MKMNKIDIRDIKGITLLSIEEAESIPEDIRTTGNRYWLRSPGNRYWLHSRDYHSFLATFVYRFGGVCCAGCNANFSNCGIRPALIIPNLKSYGFEDYSKVKLFDREWFVINDLGYLLLDGDLGCHRLDGESNDYETSEIKEFIEDWLKRMLKFFSPVSLNPTQRDRLNAMTNEEFYEFITGDEFEILKRRSTSFRDDFLEWLDSDVESSRILQSVEHTPDGDVFCYFDGYKECVPYANLMPICEAKHLCEKQNSYPIDESEAKKNE